MLNSLEITADAADYAKFSANFMGTKMESGSGTPSYTTQTEFIGRDANVYFGDTVSDLN